MSLLGKHAILLVLSCAASSVSLNCKLSSRVGFKLSVIKVRKKNEDGTVGQHTQKMMIIPQKVNKTQLALLQR